MKKLLFLILIILFQWQGFAQTNLNFDYQIYYKTTSLDTLVYDSLCNRVCKVFLDDTLNIDSIHVKIGTAENLSDILDYSFAWDVTTGLPSGLNYYREEKIIYLWLLQTYMADMYYYELQLEDSSGNLSNIKKWH